MKSPLEQFDIINIKSLHTSVLDISFNNILVTFLFVIIISMFFLYLYRNNFNIISNYFQNIVEQLYIFLINLIKQQAHQYGLF
jgi:F0F1-type ATP synthase membrane subunit a